MLDNDPPGSRVELVETANRPCLANGRKFATIVGACRSSHGSGIDNDASFPGRSFMVSYQTLLWEDVAPLPPPYIYTYPPLSPCCGQLIEHQLAPRIQPESHTMISPGCVDVQLGFSVNGRSWGNTGDLFDCTREGKRLRASHRG